MILFLFIIVLSFLFALKYKKTENKLSLNDKFGFLRNYSDLDQEKIEETGAGWIRLNFGYFVWGAIQKEKNASYDFSKTDKIIKNIQNRGLKLLVTIFPYADWDQKDYGKKCRVSDNDEMLPRKKGDYETEGLPYYRCNPKDWQAYEEWLSSFVERYDKDGKDDMPGLKQAVIYYEIGNEPDLTKNKEDEPGIEFYLGTPEDYALLLKHSYQAIKSANKDAKVLIAAMAGVQPNFVDYWKKVFLDKEIANFFDIGNIHCLSIPSGNINDEVGQNANDLNVSFYKNFLLGFGIKKPIWVTEAENIQGNNEKENFEKLKTSVVNAFKNGAEKIFFTGASLTNDPLKYTSEILIKEKKYYQEIISEIK